MMVVIGYLDTRLHQSKRLISMARRGLLRMAGTAKQEGRLPTSVNAECVIEWVVLRMLVRYVPVHSACL